MKMLAAGIAIPLLACVALCFLVPGAGDARRPPSMRASAPGEPRAERGKREVEAPGDAAFWEWRLAYPTGRYSPHWYADARPSDARLRKATPRATPDGEAATGVLPADRATALGPAPLANPTYGLVAGRVTAIVTHPADPRIAWFGSDGGGVWKTTDCCSAGTTWTPKTDAVGIADIAIGTLALDPTDPDILYAGTGDFRRNRPFVFGAGGLLKSIDGGEHWQVLATDVFDPAYEQPPGRFPQYRAMSAIVVDPHAPSRVVVGTNQGLYFSHDGGSHFDGPCYTNAWTSQRQDVTGMIAVDDGERTDLLVAIGAIGRPSDVRADLRENGANGVYRAAMPASGCASGWSLLSRADNGWPAGSGSGRPAYAGGNPLGRLDLAVAPGRRDTIYVQAMGMGVFRTRDGGATWTNSAVPPADFASGCVNDAYANGMLFEDYNAGLLVDPTNADTLFLSSTDLWRSTDGADTFADLTCGYDEIAPDRPGSVHVDNHVRAFVGGDPDRLLIGNDGGIYYSADARAQRPTFVAMNGGTNTIEFYSGDITARFDDPATTMRGISGGAQDNTSSSQTWGAGEPPGLAHWGTRLDGDGTYTKIEPILAQRWYYSAQFGFIVASTDGPHADAAQLVAPYDEQTGEVWRGDRTGFLMNYDLYKFGGDDTCPPTTGCQRMLAGTYRAWESLSGGLPNTSWYPTSPDLTKRITTSANLSIINRVRYAYSDPTRALVGTNDGNVWGGIALGGGAARPARWIDLTGDNAVLPNRPVMDVVHDPAAPDVGYAALAGFDQNTPATPGHVYRVDCDPGCSAFRWSNRSGNLPNIPVNAILLNPNVPGQAYAGTDWGLYYTDDIDADAPTWNRFDAGLPSAMVWDLVIDRGATTLAIFTRSRGAWVWPLPQARAPAAPRAHSTHALAPLPGRR
ncbi:hypothetical protein [Dokdonella sp.]|uniref:WD40/YVTN/BNR-like repeat-containing protein n=1 Tax=Dokdonella sp. TaxID=2291710 RepID=UPI002F3E7CA4